MNWLKHGKIFDPTEHSLPHGCVEYAQSPQTLVFDDFVRIYFSTRSVDAHGKYLSHIAIVDMSKNLRAVLRISSHSVIPLGGLGCFDEHGLFPMNVVRHGDLIYGYTCGWSRRVRIWPSLPFCRSRSIGGPRNWYGFPVASTASGRR